MTTSKRRWHEWERIRCYECGRFCIPADDGTFYGGPCDLEPPDTSFFCPVCAKRRMDVAMHKPEKVILGCWWIKPDYVAVAKAVLRHRRRHPRACVVEEERT